MQTSSFVVLLVGASAATFAAVFLATGAPKAPAAPQPAMALAALTAPSSGSAVEAPVHYSGCNEVRALGKAPLYRDQPGYRSDMDGDDDGIACEPHR